MSGAIASDVEDQGDLVTLRCSGAVAVLMLNEPQRRNPLSLRLRAQLGDRLLQVNGDPQVRVIVLTGAQEHFSAGGDVREMGDTTLLASRARFDAVKQLVRLLAAGPKPLVAAVEGACFGAGLSIACLCDYVIASSNARFCAAFMRVGLMPDLGGLWSVQSKVGLSKAREIFGLAREFDSAEAQRLGIANERVPPGQALARALEVAHEYAALPPVAQALLRSAFSQGVDSLDAALRTESDYQPMLRETLDHREAVAAFREKRQPHFIGR